MGRRRMKAGAALAPLLVACVLAGPAAAEAAPATGGAAASVISAPLDSWAEHGAQEARRPGQPRARAACPFCVAAVAVAIRTAAVRAAPVAVRAISSGVVKTGTKAGRRIKSGAKKAYRWTKATKEAAALAVLRLYNDLPKIVKGCARGFADYYRDERPSLLKAAISCGRGIIDILLGKDPLRPIDR